MKKVEAGCECGTHGGVGGVGVLHIHTGCWCENVKERDQFEDVGIIGELY